MTTKYIVWVKDEGRWCEQGDGPLSLKTAERIAREIRQDFGCRVKVMLAGLHPTDFERSAE